MHDLLQPDFPGQIHSLPVIVVEFLQKKESLVSEKEVLPVEIHSVQKVPTDHVYEDWLRDRHVQEIIQLLHGAVTSYMETKKSKQTSNKQQQKPSDIVTGSSVRFGYMFRPRPGSQTCLVEESVCKEQSGEYSLRSFHVLKDKLVVFAHPLVPGSPRMSQLMKVLKVKRQSTGQSVSISSYFQKIPSQIASSQTASQTLNYPQSDTQESTGSQSATTPQSCLSQSSSHTQNAKEVGVKENQSVCSLPQAPPSEGKRNKIKSILERGEIGKARRLQKRRKVNQSDKQSDEIDSVNEVIPEVNADSPKYLDHLKETTHTLTRIGENTFDSVKVTACASPLVSGSSKESYVIGNVQVSRVESPCVKIERDKSETGDTVTLISVEQMNEIQRDERTVQFASVESAENTSDAAEDMLENQSEPRSDSSSEMLGLPSASFCTEEARRKSSAIDMKKLKTYLKSYEGDVDTDSVTESPKFRTRKSEKREATSDEVTGASDDQLVNGNQPDMVDISRIKKQAAVPQTENNKSSHTYRFKRKFPKFSDSDSDESLPEKRAKTKPSSQKFVNLENMKSNSKKIHISNSFFTGESGKAQPTLSFFMSNKRSSKENKAGAGSKSEALRDEIGDVDEDIGDIDCELIKELSDFPKVKNEADVELKNEIRSMNSISKLNEEHLQYLIRINEKYLRKIFEGDLNYKSRLSQYTEEQVDTVMESLMSIFCKSHHKYLDYIMKVLLPEMLIKLHMDVHGTSHGESEKKLAPMQLATPP